MAKEMATRTALQVIVLERGPARNISQYASGMDEINTRRVGLVQNPADQTITHRHSLKDRAAPIRQYGAFRPGTGTGGTSEHWGGISDRYLAGFFRPGHTSTRKIWRFPHVAGLDNPGLGHHLRRV